MSVAVELANLGDRIGEYGPVALLVTVGEDSSPHVVSVAVELRDGVLAAGAGRTTSANVGRVPTVSMVWPARDGGDYCLIVDGAGTVDEESQVSVRPTRAVLHRVAGAPETLPSCVTVLDQRA